MAAKKPTKKPAPAPKKKPSKPAPKPAPKKASPPAKQARPAPATKKPAPPPQKAVASKPVSAKPAPRPPVAAPKPAAVTPLAAARKPVAPPAPAPKPENLARAEKIAQVRPAGRTKGHTPSIFKTAKKGPPVVFTLEDVKETLQTRKTVTPPPFPEPTPTATPAQAPAKKPAAPAVPEGPREVRRLGAASLADLLGGRAQTKKHVDDPADESRVPAKWKKYYRLLLDLRRHVSEGLHFHVQDTLKRSPREDSGDLSGYGQHMADAGTDTFDRDFALSLVSSEQEALAEIEAAIQRIFNGTYGTCEITGQPISAERLEAVPFTRYSVAGQAEYERQNRRKVQRGGLFLDASVDDAANFADEDTED